MKTSATQRKPAQAAKQIVYVRANVEWNGRQGFGYDGWAGETPEEAVLESYLQDGLEYGAASDKLASVEVRIEEA